MATFPIDTTIAAGDPLHPEHHTALAEAANDHETRLATVESETNQATTTVKGIVELATSAEVATGTDTVRAVTPSGTEATYVRKNVLTTKGDIYVATAAGTLVRVGVGANGTFLGADSAQASGVGWSLPPGGGGGAAWGGITGTLSAQTDLAAALAAKIDGFADPNADRIVFWDDSAGTWAALAPGTGIAISGVSLNATVANSTTQGIVELATDAEAQTGTDTGRAVTPANLTYIRGLYIGINAQTGTTYAPVLTDYGKLVTITSATACTVTLPQNSLVAFPIGASIDFVGLGAGLITFAAGTGATVVSTPSLTTRATNSAVTATKISTNGWLIVGDLA